MNHPQPLRVILPLARARMTRLRGRAPSCARLSKAGATKIEVADA